MSIFISVLLSMINLFIAICIITNANDGRILYSLNNFISELFKDRNIFGIFLSLFICILLIPSFTFVINIAILVWLLGLLKYIITNVFPFIYKFLCDIWNLGNKKNS